MPFRTRGCTRRSHRSALRSTRRPSWKDGDVTDVECHGFRFEFPDNRALKNYVEIRGDRSMQGSSLTGFAGEEVVHRAPGAVGEPSRSTSSRPSGITVLLFTRRSASMIPVPLVNSRDSHDSGSTVLANSRDVKLWHQLVLPLLVDRVAAVDDDRRVPRFAPLRRISQQRSSCTPRQKSGERRPLENLASQRHFVHLRGGHRPFRG